MHSALKAWEAGRKAEVNEANGEKGGTAGQREQPVQRARSRAEVPPMTDGKKACLNLKRRRRGNMT